MSEPSAPGDQPRRKSERLYEIDALRIVAAIAVMVYHYTFADYAGGLTAMRFDRVSQLARFGYLGVDLFFIISGFVALLTAFNRKPHEFLISRAVRLYPAFWAAVSLTTVVSAVLAKDEGISLVRFFANLTMFNALIDQPNIDVVYWTLWAEMRFYALILVLTFFTLTKQKVIVALWAWLAITLIISANVVPPPLSGLLTLVFQPEWAHYFIAGMAMCLVYRFGLNWQLGAILVATYVISVPRAISFANQVAKRYDSPISLIGVVLVVTAVFAAVLLITFRVTRPVARAWFAVLGALTYPLYLVHDHIGVLLFKHLEEHVNHWVLLIGVIVVMLVLARLISHFIEEPVAPVMRRLLTSAADRVTAVLQRRRTRAEEPPVLEQPHVPVQAARAPAGDRTDPA